MLGDTLGLSISDQVLGGCAIGLTAVLTAIAPFLMFKAGRFVEFRSPGSVSLYSVRSIPIFADQCVHIVREDRSNGVLAFVFACEAPSTLHILGFRENNLCLRLFTSESRLHLHSPWISARADWTDIEVAFPENHLPHIKVLPSKSLAELTDEVNVKGKNFMVSLSREIDSRRRTWRTVC